ncbi:MAG: deoxyhypusine synthase [Methanomicrobiales archaeon]|nr:deoxyhypusine synthase [Methanomicrobiales archaeon]
MTMIPRIPVKPGNNVAELLDGMAQTGFQGRKLGEAYRIWKAMIEDPDVYIMLGLSGAMVPAGMQECLISLVENRYIDLIVSTGANIFHDICEHCGVEHYLGHHHVDDKALYEQGIDRMYDVFAYEEEFRAVDNAISDFAEELNGFCGSSSEFLQKLGVWLAERYPKGRSLTATAAAFDIPILVPALTDSSIGIGLVIARRRGIDVSVDQIQDADDITRIVEKQKRTGVIYVGGGVPKNFIQQTQVIADIHSAACGGHDYAIQFTTDTPHFGGLSGCTFDEAISWGKEAFDCKQVQCFCDATIALPIVLSGLVGSHTLRAKR